MDEGCLKGWKGEGRRGDGLCLLWINLESVGFRGAIFGSRGCRVHGLLGCFLGIGFC
jgi:hypothetical protein